MRFLRDFLNGTKNLIKAANVLHFNVPLYEELSVENIFNQVKDDKSIISYLNYYEDHTVLPNRHFFFGILGTLEPSYLASLIKHANKIRF